MKARRLLAVVAVVAACDSSGDRVASTFEKADPLSPEVAGRLRAGLAVVDGAVVRINATPGGLDGTTWTGGGDNAIGTTTIAGLYRFENAPHEYDLGVRSGNDVVVFRELLPRYLELSFGPDRTPPAFAAKVALVVDPPPAAGRELAFFVSGGDAVGVSGDLASGVTVAIRQFSITSNASSPTTLHVVEHPIGDLTVPTAYGTADLTISAGQIAPAVVHMGPVMATATPSTITVTAPDGATASSIEIVMHYGVRIEAKRVAVATMGVPLTITPAPFAIYTMHATATNGGAVSDSGLQPFYPWEAKNALTLPAAPKPDVLAGGELSADATGVREHVLVAADGSRVRAVTTARAVPLADLAQVGAPVPPGTYTWTVQHWPSIPRMADFGGNDVRVVPPSATSAPLTVAIP